MKLWTVIVGAGVLVLGGAIFIGLDLARPPAAAPAETEWRPAKRLTITDDGGVDRSIRLQPDAKAIRAAALGRVAEFDGRWRDAQQLAQRTPRIQLASPVKDLQALARESRTLELSECLEPGREFWVAGLEAEVQSTLAFMAQERMAQDRHHKAAARDLGNWAKVVDACS